MNYFKFFLTFLKLGFISFGGGYGMILVMKEELIKKKYISEEDFMDVLVVAQSVPGPLAVNIGVASAKHIAGNLGAIIAAVGIVIPSFIIILILTLIFNMIEDNPYVEKFMTGTKPAVLALITMSFLNLFSHYKKTRPSLILIALTVVLTVVLKVHPALILIIIVVIGYFIKNLG